MMSQRTWVGTLLRAAALLFPFGAPVGWCQPAYHFEVPRLELQVTALPDAAARYDYSIEFRNLPGAHPIDIVDIGLPSPRYQMATMSATLNGNPVRSIKPSSYIDVGVEIDLGQYAIAAAQRGTLKFSGVVRDMVMSDTTDTNLASIQVRPTWFDPSLHAGTTDLRVAIHAPPGVRADELRFQDERQRYSDLVDRWGEGDAAHAVAIWRSPQFRLSDQNPKFGLSFPRRVMQRVVQKTAVGLFLEWFAGNPSVQWWSGALLMATIAFVFLRFTHGTGFVVLVLLAGVLGVSIAASPMLHLLMWPVVVGLLILNETYLHRRRGKPKYLPAMATVEGGGIKRGLTAPQAAALLETPLPKVLTMVLLGLIKKGVIQLTNDDPTTVEVLRDYVTTRPRRLEIASRKGVVLHDYEHPFLDKLMQHDGPVETCDLNEALGGLIQSVADRMQGFDLEVTREYYRRIVHRAWKEAEKVGEIRQRDEAMDRNFEWMMVDPEWTEVLEDWHRRGYDYRPRWTRSRIPTTWPQGSPVPTSPRPDANKGSAPTFGDVAGSFAGWAETTANRLARSIEPAAMGLVVPAGRGVVDLSGVDRITGDIFEALAEASAKAAREGGHGGGGGGGCACACAGCACACACAGGGR